MNFYSTFTINLFSVFQLVYHFNYIAIHANPSCNTGCRILNSKSRNTSYEILSTEFIVITSTCAKSKNISSNYRYVPRKLNQWVEAIFLIKPTHWYILNHGIKYFEWHRDISSKWIHCFHEFLFKTTLECSFLIFKFIH